MVKGAFSRLDSDQLQGDIELCLEGEPVRISYLQSCQSTNVECMRMAQHGSVVIAEKQTAGRGRRGRLWISPDSENIYCSIGLDKSMPAEFLGMISLQVGLSITQVLNAGGYTGVSLKWPNDILLQGKKLGGVLIETRVKAVDEFYLVIGFGLNINLPPLHQQHIDRPVISLHQVFPQPISRQQLLPQLVSHIYTSVSALDRNAMPALIEEFTHLDCFMGRQVEVLNGEHKITGIYSGLEENGQIKIKTEQGMQVFSAAEISLRESTACC